MSKEDFTLSNESKEISDIKIQDKEGHIIRALSCIPNHVLGIDITGLMPVLYCFENISLSSVFRLEPITSTIIKDKNLNIYQLNFYLCSNCSACKYKCSLCINKASLVLHDRSISDTDISDTDISHQKGIFILSKNIDSAWELMFNFLDTEYPTDSLSLTVKLLLCLLEKNISERTTLKEFVSVSHFLQMILFSCGNTYVLPQYMTSLYGFINLGMQRKVEEIYDGNDKLANDMLLSYNELDLFNRFEDCKSMFGYMDNLHGAFDITCYPVSELSSDGSSTATASTEKSESSSTTSSTTSSASIFIKCISANYDESTDRLYFSYILAKNRSNEISSSVRDDFSDFQLFSSCNYYLCTSLVSDWESPICSPKFICEGVTYNLPLDVLFNVYTR